MRIDEIDIRNFKNFESLHISFASGINLFVGSNGSGKTSILEAVNVALGGFFGEQESKMQRMIDISEVRLYMSNNKPTRSEKASVGAFSNVVGGGWTRNFNAVTKNNDTKQVKQASNYGSQIFEQLAEPNNRDIAPLIVYYSTQRLFRDASQSAKQKYDAAAGRRNGYLQCLKDNAIKGTLVEWLGNAVTRRATKQIQSISSTDLVLENVEKAIKKTLSYFLDEFDENQVKIYQEPDFDFELFVQIGDGYSLPISYYSDGFRNLIYLVIDLIWRASELNPWLSLDDIKQQQKGCITIDEIDLHLHPKWQAKAMGIIQELLPNVQFFISTHSPIVVGNFKQRLSGSNEAIDELFILENNSCQKVSSSFYGSDINTIIRNPMDANVRAAEVTEYINEFDKLVSDENTESEGEERAIQIARELNEILPGTDSELIRINEIVHRINSLN